MRLNPSLASSLGVPVLGLAALLVCLGHPQTGVRPQAAERSITLLVDPDPRLDKALTVCLRQQAKQVLLCRRRGKPGGLARAVADYNLVARECTPAVFRSTHLPPVLNSQSPF